MTEIELQEEGFIRIDVTKEESGNKEDYYYYSYEIGKNQTITSSESDDSYGDRWKVYLYDLDYIIEDIVDLQTFIGLTKKWKRI
jgi:hypothetical protein